MPRVLAAFALLLTCALGACDSAGTDPLDPLDPRTDLASFMTPGAAGSAGLSLPGLVHAAVHRTWTEQGAGAARALVTDLRGAQQAHAAAAGEAAAERLLAVRTEEMRIVLRVFGPAIVPRVISAVGDEALRLERSLATMSAGEAAQGRALLTDAHVLLAEAQSAAANGAWLDALDAGTRAAAVLGAGRALREAGQRVAGLEDLFVTAAAQLAADGGDTAELARYEVLRRNSASLTASAEQRRLHESLKAQREEEIRIVLKVLGPAAADGLIHEASAARGELESALARARAAGADVLRLERMSDSAHDMLNRAATSLAGGDAPAALDLASHAAGLINAARSAIAY
jgi:hypothetical protein